jgi:hypothetical protein
MPCGGSTSTSSPSDQEEEKKERQVEKKRARSTFETRPHRLEGISRKEEGGGKEK